MNEAVPGLVQDQFTIAKSALLYSWFFHPLKAAALLYSILAVELALQMRVKVTRPSMFEGDREPTLFPLLCYALQQRWITDEGFDIEVGRNARVADKIALQFPDIPRDQRYSYNLLESLVGLRNDLAHGNYMLVSGYGTMLTRGSEIINQLYPSAPAP